MYPLKFEHLYYKKVWGGRSLEKFRNDLPEGNIGESWDVACHKDETSIVSNGKFKGKRLDDLIKEKRNEIVGTKIDKFWFPLLVKLLNTTSELSVQVHPNDNYARNVENDMGKTEVWYVVDAEEEAALIVGTKGNCTKELFKEAIKSSELERYMNKIPVKKGDVYLIKSGMIHTMTGGLIIAEIQQNSDTTYRVYDYNRGRELHIKKALDVIDLNIKAKKSNGIKLTYEGYEKTHLCLGKDFSLELYDVCNEFTEKSDNERFYIFTCVDGNGEIVYDNGTEKISLGESILIPASLGKYIIKGKIKLIKSYVPDIKKVKNEILNEIIY
ncbi:MULTISPECIES: type I phosphomannose isomerase catalytic subunit [Clostridium]|uniref:type I phosphomannose isomerase catalytic subunit n=1 Tax=Clostridium TaxID=1485 RepID=UPI000825B4D7|nr:MULTISPECIES: type I phosphomannose isomerase catalytic subunit [Clostridium]PJI10200.1 mannose-6-phosphate isomerase [Clostridium sp. CT7]